MGKSNPAAQHRKADLGIQVGRERGGRCPHVRQNQQKMTDGGRAAHQHQPAPQRPRGQCGPDEGQGHRGQQGADPAGVQMHGDRVFGSGQFAGEHLKSGVGRHQAQRQQQEPVEIFAAGANDDQRAGKAAQHQRPAQGGNFFAECGCRQQCDDQWHDGPDGGELCHRHVLQAKKRKQAAQQQQQAAHALEFRVDGAQHNSGRVAAIPPQW